MNGPFTPRALNIIKRSGVEAERLRADHVGTAHLLLGLIADHDGIAVTVLVNLGVDFDHLRAEIESRAARTPAEKASAIREDPFSDAARRVLDLTAAEAWRLGHNYIGAEHLLLGLIKEEEGVAAGILRDFGVDRVSVTEDMRDLLGVPGTRDETPNLNKFSVDLTQLAREGKLDPVFGWEEEIERVIQILFRRTRSNPLLIGDPGVGMTAIIHGLAHRICRAKSPELLRGCRLISLDLASVLANAEYLGEVEVRFRSILREISESDRTILFIDPIRTIAEQRDAEGASNPARILKQAIVQGELQCICTMTPEEYATFSKTEGGFERCFERVVGGERRSTAPGPSNQQE